MRQIGQIILIGLLSLCAIACSPKSTATKTDRFEKAVPIWAEGREKEMNLSLGFRGCFSAGGEQDTYVRIAASTLYRIYINGIFVSSGPARAAHGYFRIDEVPVKKFVKEGVNIISIEVAGYNVNSYYTLDQPSFLLSEIEVDGKVVLATGSENSFEAFEIKERLKKVERYSFQRPFTEYYRLTEGYDSWRANADIPLENVTLKNQRPVKLLPRHVPMPTFDIREPVAIHSKGTLNKVIPEKYHRDRSLAAISDKLKGYAESELEVYPVSLEIQEIATKSQEMVMTLYDTQSTTFLKKNEFNIYDFGTNFSGFIGAGIKCQEPTRLMFYFDEILTDDDVKTKQRQSDICNHIVYELQPGEYDLETMESYTFRYLKLMVLEGGAEIEKIYLRKFAYPDNSMALFTSNNDKLNEIFKAAKQTFRQNSVDIFMDCPSRERAGWLCDSYFSSITERAFTGKTDVSDNFLENYALPERFEFLPEGMIPMCYPADHNDSVFIPNWSLWFILQVEDYARHGGDPRLVAKLEPRIEKLLNYFSGFENDEGLLEKLESWVFVEWSKANGFVQDVNYPSNMLYSAALECAGKLYGNEEWLKKSDIVRQAVLKQSYNGEFFVDNAIRNDDGELMITENTTEACQYYAFFFNLATPESHPELLEKLVNNFGPNRDDKVTYPDVFRANAFIGNYLRMEILSRYNLQNQLISEIQDYFHSMAELTGTLWENMQSHASCNHGFASFIGHVLYRDVLGVKEIDHVKKSITIRFTDMDLKQCSGSMPIGDEAIRLKWTRTDSAICYRVEIPDGYSLSIENASNASIIEEKVSDKLSAASTVSIQGFVGNRLDASYQNRILAQDVNRLVEPFTMKEEHRCWQGEFWGKWFTSAVLAYRYNPAPQLGEKLKQAAHALMETQTPEGYIGNYAPESRLQAWDIWGRKYCLLGLIAYYDISNDQKALEAASKQADFLIQELEEKDAMIVKMGNHRGMAASSVLEPMCQLYLRTGNSKYLDFAEEIVRQWETPDGPQLISKASIPVAERFPKPDSRNWYGWDQGQKAYEMMSCYEGLLELYRLTGNESYRKAAEQTWQSILDTEINIAGSGSAMEAWFSGRELQTAPIAHYQETCVTVTWLKFNQQMLRLTGEAKYADAIEQTFYNALLGSMRPDGADWAKYTPLHGQRLEGSEQCGMGLNCCSASGPRGLFAMPATIVMSSPQGLSVNFYMEGSYTLGTPAGREVTLHQRTDYPRTGRIEIELDLKKEEEMKISLRIPAWCDKSTVIVDGVTITNATPGEYLMIDRKWKKGDKIEIDFEMKGIIHSMHSQPSYVAITWGPIVLTRDERLKGPSLEAIITPVVKENETIDLTLNDSDDNNYWMIFSALFVPESYREGGAEPVEVELCDYASAGNSVNDTPFFKVWMPQLVNPRK